MRVRYVLFLLFILLLAIPLGLLADSSTYEGYRRIETNHLKIIYEPLYREAALQVASFGDDIYTTLSEELEYKGKGKVPVVITGRTAWANGYFAPFPSRVTLFVTSDDTLFLGHRSSSWLYSLFTHELTHYIHLTNPIGPASFLTPIFGPEVPNMNTVLMSGWWIEGITTNTESIFSDGGRGDNERFKMLIKASLLEGESIWSLHKGAYSSILPPSGRIYLTGYLMVDYIIRNFGISSFNAINHSYTKFPFFGLSPATKKITGMSTQEIYQEALKEFKMSIDEEKGKEAILISGEERASFDLINIINDTLYTTSYTLSKGISLTSFDNADTKSTLTSTIPTLKEGGMSITKDEKRAYIIYQSGNYFHPASLNSAPVSYSDIYVLDLESNKYTPITHQGSYYQVKVDEKRNRIIALEGIQERYRLIEMDLLGNNKKVLFDEKDASIYFPQVSKSTGDITAIVVREGTSALVLYSNNQWSTLVGPTDRELRTPRFIDDSHISFTSDKDAPYSLYSLNIATKETFLRYTDSIGILDAIISPTSVYYLSYRSHGESIFKVDSSHLTKKKGEFIISTPPIKEEETINIKSSLFEEKRYVDYPQFNLWLPLPYTDDNSFVPAAWTIWTSLLQKHIIQGQAGYVIEENLPRASITYQYNPGPVSFTLMGSLHEPPSRSNNISASISIPLSYKAAPSGTHYTHLSFLTGYRHSVLQQSLSLVGQIGHSFNTPRAPLDTFGKFSYSLSYALQDYVLLSIPSMKFLSIARATLSIPMPLYHQSVRLEVNNILSHGNLFSKFPIVQSILPPLYLTGYGKDGYNKTKISLYYNIPFVPLDIPFLYGGFTEIDLSLHASSYMYVGVDGFFVDETYFFGATLSLKYTLSVGANISPFIGFEIDSHGNPPAVRIGINTDILYIGENEVLGVR
ncbi:MAG: hypothetical protein EOM67_04265 [Spirochaetia bacterium]|nr:hypothetical protein [Spirochaetia bacterium]